MNIFRKASYLNGINLLAVVILFFISLSIGVADFNWLKLTNMQDYWHILLISRLPRKLEIVLTGISMAVAGMIMQILMRNRFIEPSWV